MLGVLVHPLPCRKTAARSSIIPKLYCKAEILILRVLERCQSTSEPQFQCHHTALVGPRGDSAAPVATGMGEHGPNGTKPNPNPCWASHGCNQITHLLGSINT